MSKYGVAIIGTGWGARIQVPAFREAGLEVVALAGSRLAKTQQIAAELGVAVATDNWREVLERDDVALVSIVTPPNFHQEMAIAALEAGKHVLCEKPTALNAAEAEAMAEAAAAHPDQIALIDHELRFLPALRLARQMVADGAIGEVRHAEVRLLGSARSDASRQWNWWSDAAQGGGILGAIGSHQTDLLRYLLSDEVVAAQGFAHTAIISRPDEHGQQRAVTADDVTSFHLRFSRGALAMLSASLVARSDEPNSLSLYGSAGTLRFAGSRLLHSDAGGAFSDITPAHTVNFPAGISGDFPEATVYIGAAWRAALDGERSALAPGATFADGLAIQRVLDAVRISSQEGWQATA